jgi:hypothetical protein
VSSFKDFIPFSLEWMVKNNLAKKTITTVPQKLKENSTTLFMIRLPNDKFLRSLVNTHPVP